MSRHQIVNDTVTVNGMLQDKLYLGDEYTMRNKFSGELTLRFKDGMLIQVKKEETFNVK